MTRLAACLVLASLGALGLQAADRAVAGASPTCPPATTARTVVIVDGNLYGMVRSARATYIFGWSGPPVLGFDEAVRLIRLLGVHGTDRSLRRLALRPGIGGASYADGGSIGYFNLRCNGTYRAVVVVRGKNRAPATRIWLHQEGGRTPRAFCMTPLLLPPRARLAVTFSVPLASRPPTYTIDRDADGSVHRTGTFRRGGARFPDRGGC